MVKHTQTIRRKIADELFEYVWPICGVDAERVKMELFVEIANFHKILHFGYWICLRLCEHSKTHDKITQEPYLYLSECPWKYIPPYFYIPKNKITFKNTPL